MKSDFFLIIFKIKLFDLIFVFLYHKSNLFFVLLIVYFFFFFTQLFIFVSNWKFIMSRFCNLLNQLLVLFVIYLTPLNLGWADNTSDNWIFAIWVMRLIIFKIVYNLSAYLWTSLWPKNINAFMLFVYWQSHFLTFRWTLRNRASDNNVIHQLFLKYTGISWLLRRFAAWTFELSSFWFLSFIFT